MIALYTAMNNFKTILENSMLRGSGVKVSGWLSLRAGRIWDSRSGLCIL